MRPPAGDARDSGGWVSAVWPIARWWGCALWLAAAQVSAQQRPLTTEDPEAIGAGRVLVEAGVETRWSEQFPVSGLEGTLLRVPLVGVSVGLSAIAEIQVDGGAQHLQITGRHDGPLSSLVTSAGDWTSDADDLVVATKIRVVSERDRRPALGARLATRLPNASTDTGLGLNTTDFFASLLAGKTLGPVRLVGNLGLGVLSDPTEPRQNDVVTYGLSIVLMAAARAEIVAEVNGWQNVRRHHVPPGTESRGLGRFGARVPLGKGRLDAALIVGVTSRDPCIGLAAGYTRTFDAFRVP